MSPYTPAVSSRVPLRIPRDGGARTSSQDAARASTELQTYADADFAGDVTTRRSTSGYCLLLHSGVIQWSSRLQSTCSLSTAEAETVASTEAAKQIIHYRLFLRELGRKQDGPSILFEDNQAAISMAESPELSARTKHYQIKVKFLRDIRARGIFQYQHVSTHDQLRISRLSPSVPDFLISGNLRGSTPTQDWWEYWDTERSEQSVSSPFNV